MYERIQNERSGMYVETWKKLMNTLEKQEDIRIFIYTLCFRGTRDLPKLEESKIINLASTLKKLRQVTI